VFLALAIVVSGAVVAADPANARSLRIPSYAYTVVRQHRCDWLRPLIARAGLPSTFVLIAARESGCARNGVTVANHTDLSTSRFGLNFRGSMPRYWRQVCGATHWTQMRSVSMDLRCTKAAFRHAGYRPWL
jgi:hypothetical protein